ncbi:MAG: cyclic nucleotide-binding domain-containing protein [Nitrospirae bacterium]|nr:cyclic nucleotide-binding domain-containing protein [Nitrospirota bacterium]
MGAPEPPYPPAGTSSAPRDIAIPLPEEILTLLETLGLEQVFKRGQIIFYEGHFPLGLYVHRSGLVALFRGGSVSGTSLGGCALLPQALRGERSPMTARAQGDVRVAFLGRTALHRLETERPDVAALLRAEPTAR